MKIGILTQANNAKTKTERANIIEEAQTDIIGKQTAEKNTNITKTDVKEVLDKYFINIPDNFTLDTLLQTKEEYGDYQILVSEIYRGTLEEKPLIATEMTQTQKKELYGSYITNYDCENNDDIETDEGIPGKWMIFHIDEDNIYLIASDYIISAPNGKNGGKIEVGYNSNYPRGMSFQRDILDDYEGSIDIQENLKKLNKSYFIDNNCTNNDDNMKATAYMLDTQVWSGFKGDEAEYAIGGPTLELLFEAYNQAHPDTNYPDGRYKARASNSLGYEISCDGGKSYRQPSMQEQEKLDNDDSTFVIKSTNNASGMWLATPTADGRDSLAFIDSEGLCTSRTYCGEGLYGFRPIVSLKNNMGLLKTGNNTYKIVSVK